MRINRNFEEDEYVKPISGKEFRESGMLWLVNSILHLFGMAITYDPETDKLEAAIVKYRGFGEDANDRGYIRVTEYMKDNVLELLKDCEWRSTLNEKK